MREKSNLLILAVMITFLALTATATADPYVCGDADGNGIVNVSDIVYLIRHVFGGGPEPSPLLAGDADGDEIVNVSDAVYMASYIFAGGPPPICECGTLIDIDGKTYLTIKIGEQCWMAENLKVTHYRNGDSIPKITGGVAWSGLTTGACCDYDNDPANANVYGRLYNWYAVDDSRILAPEGWHVPTDEEWKQLEIYLGMSQAQADAIGWRGTDEGGKLKETGTTHWHSPNAGATNESGFTGLPGGDRYRYGGFQNLSYYAVFWSSSEQSSDYVWYRRLYYDHSKVNRLYSDWIRGYSVRCVRD